MRAACAARIPCNPDITMTAKISYRIAAALATVYVAWVLIALFTVRSTKAVPTFFGDRGEFLLVLFATAFFVWGLAIEEIGGARRSLWKTLDDNAERYAMLVAYLFVCIVIVQEVFRRFALNFSSAWAQETAQYLFIYLGYIGAAYAVKERAHIRFDVLLHRASPRVKALLYIFAELMTILFAIIAAYWSLHTVSQLLHFGGTTPVLRVNKAWFELAVPIGFALVVFRSLQAMWRDLADLKAGRPVFAGKAMFEE
jgi:C4-dicarboxylate transporter, DctQ subunit